jgi:hypothetical protein
MDLRGAIRKKEEKESIREIISSLFPPFPLIPSLRPAGQIKNIPQSKE